MKKLLFSAAFLAVFMLNSCNRGADKEEQTTTPAPQSNNIDIKVADLGSPKDFVCGMDVEEGSIADTASFEGKTYGFCSSECKAEFIKNPQSYLAQK